VLLLVLSVALGAVDPQAMVDRLPEGPRAEAAAALELAGRSEDAALPIWRRLKERYPDEPRIFLLSALAAAGRTKASPLEDVSRAIELGLPAEERRAALMLRASIYANLGKEKQAGADAAELLSLEPQNLFALEVALRSAAAQRHLRDARKYAEALAAADAQSSLPHVYLAAAAVDEKEYEQGRAELRKAKKLGARGELVDQIEKTIDANMEVELPVDVALCAAAALALALALVVALGLPLVSLQRRRPAAKGLIDSAHAMLLWLAMVLFYLGFPVVLGFAGLAAYALIWLAFQGTFAAPFINIRMLVVLAGVILGAILSFVGVITGFLARPARQRLRILVREEAPELFAAIAEVSRVVESRVVDRVEIALGPELSVHEDGSTFAVLFGRGKRVLSLGLTALRGVSVSGLKSVLVHEFGHFAHGETRVSPVIAGVTLRLASICANYESLGIVGVINPVYWYLETYLWVFRRLTAALSRRQELQADMVAARAYGGEPFSVALKAVGANQRLYARYFLQVVLELRRSGCQITDGVNILDAIDAGLPPALRVLLLLESGKAPRAIKTHPEIEDRIGSVAGLCASRLAEPEPWTSLLPQHRELSRQLTAEVMEGIAAKLAEHDELPAAHLELLPEEQGRLAVALAIHLEAVDAFARAQKQGQPEAVLVSAIAESVNGISAAAPERARVLAQPLKQLASAQAALGRLEEAEVTIDRALALTGSSPETRVEALEFQSMKRSLRSSRGLYTPELVEAAASPSGLRPEPSAPEAPQEVERPQSTQDLGKLACSACGSVSPLQDIRRRGACPWCGAVLADLPASAISE
jgi:Zn-dependent protease with chaperone function